MRFGCECIGKRTRFGCERICECIEKNRCDSDASHSHSQRPDTKARHQSQTQTPDPPDSPPQDPDSGGSVERPDLGATPPVALAPRRRGNGADPLSAVAGIFDCWRDTLGHPRARLDAKRRKVIDRALKLGYTAAELCEAIHGCAVTPHNMGVNDRGHALRRPGVDSARRRSHRPFHPQRPRTASTANRRRSAVSAQRRQCRNRHALAGRARPTGTDR